MVGGVNALLDGGFVDKNVMILAWMIRENVSQEMSMIKNHGAGFSCGMSLRRGCAPSFSSLKG